MQRNQLFNNEDKNEAGQILIRVGIEADSEEFNALIKTVKRLVQETREQEGDMNEVRNSTRAQLYDRFVSEVFSRMGEGLIGRGENPLVVAGIQVQACKLSSTYKPLLENVALYMLENKLDQIDSSDLTKIFGSKKKFAQELLDHCPSKLIEKDDKGAYKFKEGLPLRDYFSSNNLFESAMKDQRKLK